MIFIWMQDSCSNVLLYASKKIFCVSSSASFVVDHVLEYDDICADPRIVCFKATNRIRPRMLWHGNIWRSTSQRRYIFPTEFVLEIFWGYDTFFFWVFFYVYFRAYQSWTTLC